MYRVSPKQAAVIEAAVKVIYARDEYPSSARILRELGRSSIAMCGPERRVRREIFDRLGIKKIRTGAPLGNQNAFKHGRYRR